MILTDLKSKIKNDFPDAPDVNYSIEYISDSLKDYASPAMYFTPQLDNLSVNSIYINPTESDSNTLYATLAHEGYPGHMYQMTYFTSMQSRPNKICHPAVRLFRGLGNLLRGSFISVCRYGKLCIKPDCAG